MKLHLFTTLAGRTIDVAYFDVRGSFVIRFTDGIEVEVFPTCDESLGVTIDGTTDYAE